MSPAFASRFAGDLTAFLAFKRARGIKYARAEFMLKNFDRFATSRARPDGAWRIDETILAWLANRPGRKANSVAMELSVIREFWRYLRRCDPRRVSAEPRWPKLPSEPRFVAYVFSPSEIKILLRLVSALSRPKFRRHLYRALILTLYCTGLRVGEALHLRVRDLDLRRRVIFVVESKGRSRWVPFHSSLAAELGRYLRARRTYVGREAAPGDLVFVGANRQRLPNSTAGYTFSKLYRSAGIKPENGRVGPRPYDLRHTFAVHRLTRWYRQGVDLQGRLPWLSAYLGHVDLLGTETYLSATPELMALAGERFHRRYERSKRDDG